MLEQIRRLQREMESLSDAVDGKLGALRTKMREGFARQERGLAELGRDVARQGASFDQTVAGMLEDFGRSRRNQSTIWAALIERTAEMQNDVGDLRRRVDDLERRMAG